MPRGICFKENRKYLRLNLEKCIINRQVFVSPLMDMTSELLSQTKCHLTFSGWSNRQHMISVTKDVFDKFMPIFKQITTESRTRAHMHVKVAQQKTSTAKIVHFVILIP